MTITENKSIPIAKKIITFDGKDFVPVNPFPDQSKLVRIVLHLMGMSVPEIAKETGFVPGYVYQFIEGKCKSRRLYDYFQKIGINLNREEYNDL